MADISVPRNSGDHRGGQEPARSVAPARDPAFDLIELLFFAYRDFVADADHVLERYGFGRAHHRVLHFVHRHPELRVADLLDILRITKQSLARVLKDLIEQGFVTQSSGQSDRRQRLLAVTEAGRALALELARLQSVRFARALSGSDMSREAAARFLFSMIDPDGRDDVARLIARADRTAKRARS